MKKFKRFIAMVMTVAMVAGLGVTASAGSTPAVEDYQQTRSDTKTPNKGSDNGAQKEQKSDQYKITIKGSNINTVDGKTQNNHLYRAYQIFAGDVNKAKVSGSTDVYNDQLSVTGWGKDVDGDALLNALQNDPRFQTTPNPDPSDTTLYPQGDQDPAYITALAAAKDTNLFKGATGFAGVASVIGKWNDGRVTGNEDPAHINTMTDAFADVVSQNLIAPPTAQLTAPTPLPTSPAPTQAETDAYNAALNDYKSNLNWADAKLNPDYPAGATDEQKAEAQLAALTAWNDAHKLTWDATAKTYTSGDLDEGYYLVRDEGPAAATDDYISKNIIELLGGDVEIAPKGSVPTVKKDVIVATNQTKPDESAPDAAQSSNAVEANIGDTVWYTLEGTLSNMVQDYDTYKYRFVDKMSGGLDFGTVEQASNREALSTSYQDAYRAYAEAAEALKDALDKRTNEWQDTSDGSTLATALSTAESQKRTAEGQRDAAQAQMKAATTDEAYAAAERDFNNAVAAIRTAEAAIQLAQGAIDDANEANAKLENAVTKARTAYTDAKKDYQARKTAVAAVTTTDDTTTPPTADSTTLAANMPYGTADAAAMQEYNAWANQHNTKHSLSASTATATETVKVLNDATPPEEVDETVTYEYMAPATVNNIGAQKYAQAQQRALETAVNTAADGGLKVYLYNNAGTKLGLVDPDCYTVTLTPGQGMDGGDKLVIDFKDVKTIKLDDNSTNPGVRNSTTNGAAFKDPATATAGTTQLDSPKAGDKLVVVYKAVLNEDAVVGNPGNDNEVRLEYSNNPDSEDEGESKPDDAIVFTFGLNINKIDKNSKERLTDAGFLLYKERNASGEGTNAKIRNYAVLEDNGDGTYTFVKWSPDVTIESNFKFDADAKAAAMGDPNNATELKTTNNGRFEVKGLKSGEYVLVESTVPNGYDPANLGKTFPMNIEATLAELAGEEQVPCGNKYNPNFINKYAKDSEGKPTYTPTVTDAATGIPTDSSYTAADVAAGVHLMYVDAYGTPTADNTLRVKNPNYDPNDSETEGKQKWIKTEEVAEPATPATYTNKDTEALAQTMTLKTYKVEDLKLNGNSVGQSSGENVGTAAMRGDMLQDIENSLDVTLPETGGIGTTIFYIVGGVLVVGAAVVMITRKRVEG